MNIKDALAVVKPHLPIFQSELIMQAWQTLEDCGTQPTDVQQLYTKIAAEIDAVADTMQSNGASAVSISSLRSWSRKLRQ